jgi:hypothetical protein
MLNTRVCPKVCGLSHTELNNNKHSLRSNTKGLQRQYLLADSQNGDKTAASGRELYHLQFSLHAASPETFGCTIVCLSYSYQALSSYKPTFMYLTMKMG